MTASTVSSRNGKPLRVRPHEADLRTGVGAHRAGQHRLGDVDTQRETVGSCGARQ